MFDNTRSSHIYFAWSLEHVENMLATGKRSRGILLGILWNSYSFVSTFAGLIQQWFIIDTNTRITVFFGLYREILSEVFVPGAILPLQIEKNSWYCFHCRNMLKNYHTETKLFELSQDTNRKELKVRKKMTSLCNGFTL